MHHEGTQAALVAVTSDTTRACNTRIVIDCDGCGRCYDADPALRIPTGRGKEVWACPNCGTPSVAIRCEV